MASRAGGYVRRNHLGLIAIFIALSGTAWAANKVTSNDIAKNAVRSKHIKAGQIKPGDLAKRARVACPATTKRFDDLCVRTATATLFTWDQALAQCGDLGLRLPGVSEAERLSANFNVPGVGAGDGYWTDEFLDTTDYPTPTEVIVANEDTGFWLGQPREAITLMLCVTEPSPGA